MENRPGQVALDEIRNTSAQIGDKRKEVLKALIVPAIFRLERTTLPDNVDQKKAQELIFLTERQNIVLGLIDVLEGMAIAVLGTAPLLFRESLALGNPDVATTVGSVGLGIIVFGLASSVEGIAAVGLAMTQAAREYRAIETKSQS